MPPYGNANQIQPSKYVIPANRYMAAPEASSWRSVPAAPMHHSEDAFIPRGRTGLVVAKPNVSEHLVRKANWIVQALPEGLQKHFRDKGCQIKLAQTMDEIFPDLRDGDEFVTNMAHNRSWRQIRGCARGRVVGMPEYIQEPGKTHLTPQTDPGRGLNVARHELGHLLHNSSRLLYDEAGNVNDEFYDAYMEDLSKMSYSQGKRFRYCIQTKDINQPTVGGMKEAFAEIFGAEFGGGCKDDEAVKAAFPKTTRYMRAAVRELIAKCPK